MYYEGQYNAIPNSYLTLKADSTYELINAPDWLFQDSGDSHQKYFSNKGRWSCDCYEGNCELGLEFGEVKRGEPIGKKSGKLAILFNVGDPDSCQGMVYEEQ